jgi:hypothetical protein
MEDNPSNIAFRCDLVETCPASSLLTAPTAEIGLELIGLSAAALLKDTRAPGMPGSTAT